MNYDVIVIGGGPAGLTAGIYGAMANKKVLVLEKMFAGGQVAYINKIKNFSGFEEIDGFELANKIKKQALNLGVEIKNEEVTSCNLSDKVKIVNTHKNEYTSKAVIIATGAYAKPLDVENEKSFLGRGLSYCATCDGSLYKDKTVAVVGGGDSSIDDCIYLSNIVKKIYLIHRRDEFKANETSLNKVKSMSTGENAKIEMLTNSIVTNLIGENSLEKVEILNKLTNQTKQLDVDGIFVAIGRKPDVELFANLIELDKGGFIQTDDKMRTNIENVYAVGDVRNTPLRQIITACSDGAIAMTDFIKNYKDNN